VPLEPTTVPDAPRLPLPPAYVPVATPPGAPAPNGLRARLRARRAGARGAAFGRGVVVEVAKGARLEIAAGATIGDGCRIVVRGGVIRIGEGAALGERCRLIAHEQIDIGPGAVLGDEAVAVDFDHRYDDVELPVRLQGVATAPVVVGAHARIGARAAIQRGVTIGSGAEVGPLAVVTRNVKPGARVGGVPALSPSASGPGTPGGSRSRPAR
jgi:acetyltransferase-like isoleucine patch superfamily enzyme